MRAEESLSSAKGGAALQRELAYQESRARKLELTATPEYVFERYSKCRLWRFLHKEFMYKSLGDVSGKKILDFACGEGQVSSQLARLGAEVTGIDISPELIALARRRAELDRVADRTTFVAADLLVDRPPQGYFDIVFCSAALHHVDMAAVLPVLFECLRPGGKVVIGEPVALSSTLQKLRDRVPLSKDASPDERQLEANDLDRIRSTFANCEFRYFNCVGRLTRLVPNANKIDKGHPVARAAVVGLAAVDRVLATVPAARRFFGTVVITGEKPAAQAHAAPARLEAAAAGH